MKSILWTNHALQNLVDREISRQEAELALLDPEFIVPAQSARQIFMRRYFDTSLQQQMLLRIVVKETSTYLVVITLYKTSQIAKYLRECQP